MAADVAGLLSFLQSALRGPDPDLSAASRAIAERDAATRAALMDQLLLCRDRVAKLEADNSALRAENARLLRGGEEIGAKESTFVSGSAGDLVPRPGESGIGESGESLYGRSGEDDVVVISDDDCGVGDDSKIIGTTKNDGTGNDSKIIGTRTPDMKIFCDEDDGSGDDDKIIGTRTPGVKRAKRLFESSSESDDDDAPIATLCKVGKPEAVDGEVAETPVRRLKRLRAFQDVVPNETPHCEDAQPRRVTRSAAIKSGLSCSESEDEDETTTWKDRAVASVYAEGSSSKRRRMPSARKNADARCRSTRVTASTAAKRMLSYSESEECDVDGSGSDTDSMNSFIVSGSEGEESESSSSIQENEDDNEGVIEKVEKREEDEDEEEEEEDEESDDDLETVLVKLRRGNRKKKWEYEGDMLAAFASDPELCMKAVCALYERQTEDEQKTKMTMHANRQGFSQFDAERASKIAEFLMDGNSDHIGKSVEDLRAFDRTALEFCQKVASKYSKQLFSIYTNKECSYFP